jgi:hypothetical protein
MIKKIQKIMLVNSAQSQFSRPPSGLAFMAGVCESVQVEHQTLDLNLEFLKSVGQDMWDQTYIHSSYNLNLANDNIQVTVDQFLDQQISRILDFQPDCVALHVLTYFNQQWAERFLIKLKLLLPDITVIAGGPGISVPRYLEDQRNSINVESFGQYLCQQKLLDYYVLGEGDIIFKNFLLGQREAVGLNSANKLESWQPQLDDLDELCAPSYQSIAISEYYSVHETPVLSITGSRGCVRRCSFCDVGHFWKKYRFRSGKKIAEEIVKHHRDTSALNFWFTDSLINGSLKQFKEMQSSLIEFCNDYPELKNLRYSGQFIIRPKASHPEELYAMMRETGCRHIEVGIESGSEAVRTHIGKKFSNDDIDHHFEMCEKYGIQNWILVMVGYPTETDEDFQQTVNMLRRYQKYILNGTAFGMQLNRPASILPHTPLHDMKDQLGIQLTGHNDEMQQWVVSSNPGLSLEKRYLRWLELTKLALDLGYNLPAEIMVTVETNLQAWQDHNNIQNSKPKVIPIFSATNIYS